VKGNEWIPRIASLHKHHSLFCHVQVLIWSTGFQVLGSQVHTDEETQIGNVEDVTLVPHGTDNLVESSDIPSSVPEPESVQESHDEKVEDLGTQTINLVPTESESVSGNVTPTQSITKEE